MNQTDTLSISNIKQALPDLIVESAMVNPNGKQSRIGSVVPNDILNTEWVQLRNMTDRPLLLNSLELKHLIYSGGEEGKLTRIMVLQGQLPPDRFLRIHSGRGNTSFDKKRRIYNIYVNSAVQSFSYQIARGDTIAIVHPQGTIIDQAVYEFPVLEGVRLKRVPPVTSQRLAHPE